MCFICRISLFVFGMTLVCKFSWVGISMNVDGCVRGWMCAEMCMWSFLYLFIQALIHWITPKIIFPMSLSFGSFSLHPICWLSINSVVIYIDKNIFHLFFNVFIDLPFKKIIMDDSPCKVIMLIIKSCISLLNNMF